MLIATLGSSGYKVLLVLHLVFVVAAFAPAFVWPMMNRQRRALATSDHDTAGPGSAEMIGRLADPMMHGGSLVLAGLFGILTVVVCDPVYAFSQTWISIAFVLWFMMLGVFFAGILPAQRLVRERNEDGEQRIAMCYGGMHLLLALQIIVMVWKPGL